MFTEERAVLANRRVADLKTRFLERDDVPSWMPKAAMKAGVEFFRAQRMWQAYKSRGLVEAERLSALDVRGWFHMFVDVLAHMPVARLADYLDSKKTPTPQTRLNALVVSLGGGDTVPWIRPEGWDATWQELEGVVLAYMEGRSFAEIGAALFGTTASDCSSARGDGARGLPPVFKFVGDLIERTLAVDAGCFLALHECLFEAEHPGVTVPESLQALPLCVRNGCDSLDVLAWFRFGLRQRVCAHALAKAFPVPGDVQDDKGRATFIRSTRRRWLAEEPEGIVPLLDFARVIVRDGASERT